ncbi:Cas10/Cmr2 second palm domain-containing protein [Gordonia bronchialis]|uniref:Cas10/Cmr2 second palm domain-containing protein n=1 Tax=Gordonia bronchialis TaxID=2054 RepID=UPI0039845B64
MEAPLHWVIIETGSNQAYIFSTNKQRLQVAASAAVWQLGMEWIPEAIRGPGLTLVPGNANGGSDPIGVFRRDPNAVLHVVKASGRAVLLVHNEEHGRSIIRHVTRHALEERTGLDVWGHVGPALASDLSDAGKQFFVTDVGLRRQRTQRFSPITRFPTLPFHQPCAYTGLPAVRWDKETPKEPDLQARSDVIDFLFGNATKARKRMIKSAYGELTSEDQGFARYVMVRPEDLSGEGLSDNGWIGILHADGNGVGKIFANLRYAYQGEQFVRKQAELSSRLDDLTWMALRDTIVGRDSATGELTAQWRVDEENPTKYRNSILPIVVGGDDVSAALSGVIAFDFAELLARNFSHYAADEHGRPFRDALAAVKTALGADSAEASAIPDGLSLAVGLVFTKAHHPFSHSIEVAESLTSEAKKGSGRRYSAIDTHVLFESAVRDLEAIRKHMTFDDETFTYAGTPIAVPLTSTERAQATEDGLMTVDDVRALQGELTTDKETETPRLSRSQIQMFKQAITESKDHDTLTQKIALVRNRLAVLDVTIPSLVDHQLPDVTRDSASTMFTQALDLIDVARGTVESSHEHNNANGPSSADAEATL